MGGLGNGALIGPISGRNRSARGLLGTDGVSLAAAKERG